MKKLILTIILTFFTISSVLADTWVSGNYRSDPNAYKIDNWSTKGNVNPYTGKSGTRTYGGTCAGYSLLNC